MRAVIIAITVSVLFSFRSHACSCYCKGDCSFSKVSNKAEFVALVKVISYDHFLGEDMEIPGHQGKMPLSMTVEVVEKYKGKEERNRFIIWGDNGALCRPYISNFKLGEYFLIAPNEITSNDSMGESKGDYTFFACNTDYLKVDMGKAVATGEYSKRKSKISLSEFEKRLK